MMSQSTVFMAEAPKGFYAQLADGQVPAGCSRSTSAQDNPVKMWRVVG